MTIAVARAFKILASFHGADIPESLEKFTEMEKQLYSMKFIAVKNLILGGDTEFALEGIDALEKMFMQFHKIFYYVTSG